MSPSARSRGRVVAALTAFLLLTTLPPSASAEPPPTITPLTGGDGGATITLVTGDRVDLRAGADGRQAVAVDPAPRPDGVEARFEVVTAAEQTYVIPSDAAALIPDRVDRELFNITKLADYGYTDGVPVIVTDAPAQRLQAAGMTAATPLTSVNGYAATVAGDGRWWSAATSGLSVAARGPAPKVWLDELGKVDLAESVPMIGAPQAWAAGVDGTGTTVAVLDTGIDANHPDLVGQVAGTRNFTTEAGMDDKHGHGTHVAGTIAGTGAGSNSTYKGVAPGADLLIGKICTSNGSCPNSATIAAMEWAAQSADVVSISIGTSAGDNGTSPSALAVNRLTARYNTLFVIAAGNNGTQGPGSVSSPGSADAALTVGAVDKTEKLASFSGTGPRLGDFAMKPDVTAPGVGIVAPRAEGTSMGTPVNADYTRANGTSMATPHVAGAAALVLQKYPDLGAADLKANLVSTAKPNPSLTGYQQGGGMVQVQDALAAPVVANPSPLQMGFFAYPQADLDPVTKPVTYTNRTQQDVTLTLALSVRDGNGTEAPATGVSVRDTTLVVPAGGTAQTTVTVDPAALPIGTYGGHLTATAGDKRVRTPVGFHLEQESFDITVTGTTRDGRPANNHSSMWLIDTKAANSAYTQIRFVDGVARARVPAGTYTAWGVIRTMDGHNQIAQDATAVGLPPTELKADLNVSLDARQAGPVTVSTPEHPDATSVGHQSRIIQYYKGPNGEDMYITWVGEKKPMYVLKTDPVRVGEYEFLPHQRLAAPVLKLEMVAPDHTEFYAHPLLGGGRVDGSADLPLVFAGDGAESDYQGVDATGKIVLTRRTGPDAATKEAVARAHGAKALAIMNDTTGHFSVSVGNAAQLPVMSLSGEHGQALLDKLAAGQVTMRLSGTVVSPYVYEVVAPTAGALPAKAHHTVDYDKVATLRNAYHGEPGEPLSEYRAVWRPYMLFSAAQYSDLQGARQRTDYVTADNETLYRQQVSAQNISDGTLMERDSTYRPGERRDQRWFSGPMRPGVVEAAGPRAPAVPIERTGNTVTLQLRDWTDNNNPDHIGSLQPGVDAAQVRIYRDGTLLGTAPRPQVKVNNLPPTESTYRFEVDTARTAAWWPTSTRTKTAWTVRSAHTAESTKLPFLVLGYDTELDLTNTAPRPDDRDGPATLDLTVHHQAGAQTTPLAGMRVWLSYDDGKTWEKRPVQLTGKGTYTAILNSPDPADTPTGYVSLKVEAWDTANNRIEQEVTRAWRLAPR